MSFKVSTYGIQVKALETASEPLTDILLKKKSNLRMLTFFNFYIDSDKAIAP